MLVPLPNPNPVFGFAALLLLLFPKEKPVPVPPVLLPNPKPVFVVPVVLVPLPNPNPVFGFAALLLFAPAAGVVDEPNENALPVAGAAPPLFVLLLLPKEKPPEGAAVPVSAPKPVFAPVAGFAPNEKPLDAFDDALDVATDPNALFALPPPPAAFDED